MSCSSLGFRELGSDQINLMKVSCLHCSVHYWRFGNIHHLRFIGFQLISPAFDRQAPGVLVVSMEAAMLKRDRAACMLSCLCQLNPPP